MERIEEELPGEPSVGPTGIAPPEAPKKPWLKLLVIIVAAVVVVAGVVGAWSAGLFEAAPSVSASWVSAGTELNVGIVGNPITFNASASGAIAEYIWDFGDGVQKKTTENSTRHIYVVDGTYTVLLTVRSPMGKVATNDDSLLQVQVKDTVPIGAGITVATIIVPKTVTVVGESLSFDGAPSFVYQSTVVVGQFLADTTKIVKYRWDFGDGTAIVEGADKGSVTHTFTKSGNFPVRLAVESTGGVVDVTITTIRVRDKGVALVKNPDTFIVASIGDPDTLDPAVDYETAGNEIIRNVYDRLVEREITVDAQGKPSINNDKIVGSLATSWTIDTPDGKNWTFNIRQGVKFSDGTELKAADVEFSIERVLVINIGPSWILDQTFTGYAADNASTPQNERWDIINASVEVVGDYTVKFHLATAYGAFLQTLDYQVASIVSKSYVTANGGLQWETENEWMKTHMMGTGPFMLERWTVGVDLKLVPNPNYWGPYKPKLKAALYKVIVDAATQELLFKNGDVDYVEGVPIRDIPMVIKWKGVTYQKEPTLIIHYLAMLNDNSWANWTNKVYTPERLNNTSPFQDKHIRLAVSYAINYTFIQNEILIGLQTQLRSPLPYGMPGYNGSYWKYEYNLTEARKHLDMADPRWVKDLQENGTEVWYNTGNRVREQIAGLVAANLKNLNITVEVKQAPWPEYLSRIDFKQNPMYIIGWAPDYLDPDDYVTPLFHSDICPQPRENGNKSTQGTAGACYSNPSVDANITKAAEELVWSERAVLYDQVQKTIVEDAPWVFLYQSTAYNLRRDWVKGFLWEPMSLLELEFMWKEAA